MQTVTRLRQAANKSTRALSQLIHRNVRMIDSEAFNAGLAEGVGITC